MNKVSFLFAIFVNVLVLNHAGRMPRKTNCLNGTTNERCTNGGSCLQTSQSSNYYAKDKIKKSKPKNYTYCLCPSKWAGITCEEENICFKEKPCLVGHFVRCRHISPDGFKCDCISSWTGKRCESPRDYKIQHDRRENPCRSNPCGAYRSKTKGKGMCLVRYNETGHYSGYVCKCRERYTGVHCETMRDCRHDNDKCKNRGSCIKARLTRAHVCKCLDRFTGFRCEQVLNSDNNEESMDFAPEVKRQRLNSETEACASDPCRKGATCVDTLVGITESMGSTPGHFGFHCECPDDFIGDSCALPTDEELLTFENQIGACRNNLAGLPGFLDIFGFDESSDISRHVNLTVLKRSSLTRTNPCKNKGICLLQLKGFRCYCPVGLGGKLCTVQTGLAVMMKFQFKNDFDYDLLDSSSEGYLQLQRKLRLWVSSTCVGYVGEVCHLLNVQFSPGSISTHYSVMFSNRATPKLLQIARQLRVSLKQNVRNFPGTNFTIARTSISVAKIIAPQDFAGTLHYSKLVGILVIGISFCVFLIIFATYLSFAKINHFKPLGQK